MNLYKRTNREPIDVEWSRNLEKIEGKEGLSILPNDKKDLLPTLIRVLSEKRDLPCDLDNPETQNEVEAVNEYAENIYAVACEIAHTAEQMMVGHRVQRALENIIDEEGETESDQDRMREAGHTNADF